MVSLAKRLPFSSFCLFTFLSQYPSTHFLRPQNSFRSWNLLIQLSFLTARLQRYCGAPAPASCKAGQVHVTPLTKISLTFPCAEVSLSLLCVPTVQSISLVMLYIILILPMREFKDNPIHSYSLDPKTDKQWNCPGGECFIYLMSCQLEFTL